MDAHVVTHLNMYADNNHNHSVIMHLYKTKTMHNQPTFLCTNSDMSI